MYFSIKQIIINSKTITNLQLSLKPVNALTTPLLQNLHSVLDLPPTTDALILSSSFPKIFSAGLDINTLLKKPSESNSQFETRTFDYMSLFQSVVLKLLLLDIPTACVISGHAPAGGTVLSLCCDYRVAATNHKFSMGFTEVAVGMAPPMWVHSLAKHNLPPSKVFQYMELGKSVNDPLQAIELGFLHDIASDSDDAMNKAQKEMFNYNSVPKIARIDAKRKGRQEILKHFTPEGLQDVVVSISGSEFQKTANEIFNNLKSRK